MLQALPKLNFGQISGTANTVPVGKNVCYYFGTFNPVHNGHIAVAEAAAKQFGFDKVVFVPVYKAPHKDESGIVPFAQRYDMLRLACKNNPTLTVSDLEKRLSMQNPTEPSYTIRAVKYLQSLLPRGQKIPFIIGLDELKALPSWHDAKQLVEGLRFFVSPRDGSRCPRFITVNGEKLKLDRRKIEMTELGLSATKIRERLKAGQCLNGLVPDDIACYIEENRLYRS